MAAIHLLWRSRLRRDTLLLLALQIFYRLSGVVLLAILSRYLPAGDIGVYFFALSFAEAFTFVATFRLNPVLLRRVAADPVQATTHFASILGFRLVSGPLYLLCVSGAAVPLTGAAWRVVVFVAVCTLLENLYFAFTHLFLALRKVGYDVAIGMLVQVVFLAVFLLGMWQRPSLDVLLGANLLRSLCLVGAAVFVTHRWLCPLRIAWDSSLVRAGAPFTLLTLFAMLRDKLDTLLLGFFTDYNSVGHYALAFRVVSTSLFGPMAVGQACFPQLAAHGLSAENRRLLVRGAKGLLGLGLLGMSVVFLGAVPLTAILYGAPAVDTITPLLRPLTLLFPLSFLQLFLSSALQALHQETKALGAAAISTGVSLLANCTLIPFWGAYGVVAVRVLSTLLELAVLVWQVRRLWLRTTPLGAQRLASADLSLPTTGLE